MERKYYRNREAIVYQKQHKGVFVTTPAKYYYMLFYEENGEFFELLTGQFLGIRKKYGQYFYIFSEEFGYTIPLSGYSLGRHAEHITAEEFAARARVYMEKKSNILPAIHQHFYAWRLKYKEYKEKKQAEYIAEKNQQREDQQNLDWLSQLLDSRK